MKCTKRLNNTERAEEGSEESKTDKKWQERKLEGGDSGVPPCWMTLLT